MQDLRKLELTYLPGIGPNRAKMLSQELNINSWHDLLYYFPYKHIDRSRLYMISELTADMPFVQVKGQILSFEEAGAGRKKHLIAHFTDGSMLMDLVWFNGISYSRKA
jgi:ATP-dependent DNA helicase RecG